MLTSLDRAGQGYDKPEEGMPSLAIGDLQSRPLNDAHNLGPASSTAMAHATTY